MRLRALVAATREVIEEWEEVVDPPSSRAPDHNRNTFVVDEEFIGPDGRPRRRWISTRGDSRDVTACAAINPVSARLFALCDRVLTEEQKDDRTRPRQQWEWLRKTDGAIVEIAPSAVGGGE